MSESTPAIFHRTEPAMVSHITWTDAGLGQYKAMKHNIEIVRAYHGPRAAEHVANSLFYCMERLFTCGPCNVQKDGDSLYVTTEHIVFGVNWHPVNAPTFHMLTSFPLEETDPTWPQIGTWSLNS